MSTVSERRLGAAYALGAAAGRIAATRCDEHGVEHSVAVSLTLRDLAGELLEWSTAVLRGEDPFTIDP